MPSPVEPRINALNAILERINGRIRVFREEEQLGTDIVDTTFTFGKIGVGSRNNAATFDHVLVERR